MPLGNGRIFFLIQNLREANESCLICLIVTLSPGISHVFSEFSCPGVVDLLRWAHTGVSTRTQTGTAANKGVDLKRFASARMCKLFDVKGVRTINSAKKNGNLSPSCLL